MQKLRIKEALDNYNEQNNTSFTLADIARKIDADVSLNTVQNYFQRGVEKGDKRTVPNYIVVQLAEILGTTTDFLYGIDNNVESIENVIEKIGSLTKEIDKERLKLIRKK